MECYVIIFDFIKMEYNDRYGPWSIVSQYLELRDINELRRVSKSLYDKVLIRHHVIPEEHLHHYSPSEVANYVGMRVYSDLQNLVHMTLTVNTDTVIPMFKFLETLTITTTSKTDITVDIRNQPNLKLLVIKSEGDRCRVIVNKCDNLEMFTSHNNHAVIFKYDIPNLKYVKLTDGTLFINLYDHNFESLYSLDTNSINIKTPIELSSSVKILSCTNTVFRSLRYNHLLEKLICSNTRGLERVDAVNIVWGSQPISANLYNTVSLTLIDVEIDRIPYCPMLTSLTLNESRCNISQSNVRNLKHLQITYTSHIPFTFDIEQLDYLETLKINNLHDIVLPLYMSVIESFYLRSYKQYTLPHMPNIKKLELHSLHSYVDIQQYNMLETLVLVGKEIPDIPNIMTELKTLKIKPNGNLSIKLPLMPNIENIELVNITSAIDLSSYSHIKTLDIENCTIPKLPAIMMNLTSLRIIIAGEFTLPSMPNIKRIQLGNLYLNKRFSTYNDLHTLILNNVRSYDIPHQPSLKRYILNGRERTIS